MKIFFLLHHPAYIRLYDSTIRELARGGHHVHLGFNVIKSSAPSGDLHIRLSRDFPTVTCQAALVPARHGVWGAFGMALCGLIDLLRFIHPMYTDAPKLRERIEQKMPWILVKMLRVLPGLRSGRGVPFLIKMLTKLYGTFPGCRRVADFLRNLSPDLLLVSPLTNFASEQAEYVKCAKCLGVKTVLCVASWDNLTNRGLIRVESDAVMVWNEVQKREAIELHGISPEKVIVTGAQCFDHWFEQRCHTSREEFCGKVGLPPTRPYLLYLCSSPFIAGNEADFVRRWIRRIRSSSDFRLREVGILVRPHPQNAGQWRDIIFSGHGDVAIYPREGAVPISEDSKADYYDSMYHAAAVVGVNTSAFIEAGIVGRRAFTVLTDEFRNTQRGTIHFRYLVEGGLLTASESLDDHIERLAEAVSGRPDDGGVREFVRFFVRPRGLHVACTPFLVEAIEGVKGLPAKERRRGSILGERLVGWFFLPFAVAAWGALHLRRGAREIREFRQGGAPRRWVKERIPGLVSAGRQLEKILAISLVRWKLRRIAGDAKPVIVGPWLSEVGFELLYWIPFLHWVKARYRLDERRITVVSRGGVAQWYRHVSSSYADVLEFCTEEEFRRENVARAREQQGQKHFGYSNLDKRVIGLVRRRLAARGVHVIHPSMMYSLFSSYWRERSPVRLVERHAKVLPFSPAPPSPLPSGFPDDYVAVKFYFSPCFPDTLDNRMFVRMVVENLAKRANVVLLDTGLRVDDHLDFEGEFDESVFSVRDFIDPRTNLDFQTNVVRRSRVFVGTYGGFSYLAPMCGVASVAFYSHADGFLPMHVDRARRVMAELGGARFILLHTGDLDALGGLVPEQSMTVPR